VSNTTPDGFTGSVIYWDRDLTLVPKKASGARRVGLRLARRLRTPRGHALGHPNDGTDISDALESTLDQRGAQNLRAAITAECLKDVSVKTCFTTVTLSNGGTVNTIAVRAFGDFGATTVTIQKLSDGTFATQIT